MNNADLKPPLIDLEASSMATGGKQDIMSVQPERLSEADYIYTVYWIKLQDHNDIYSQGYVGITIDFKERMRSHKKNKRKTHLYNAINKYGWNNLSKNIIESNLNKEQALEMEEDFRPRASIGWNSQKGGELGVESEWYNIVKNRISHSKNTSLATIKGISLNDTTEARSERAKVSRVKNKDSYKDINLGSRNHTAILNEDQVYNIKYNLIPEGKSNTEISKLYGVKNYIIGFIRNNKTWKHI